MTIFKEKIIVYVWADGNYVAISQQHPNFEGIQQALYFQHPPENWYLGSGAHFEEAVARALHGATEYEGAVCANCVSYQPATPEDGFCWQPQAVEADRNPVGPMEKCDRFE